MPVAAVTFNSQQYLPWPETVVVTSVFANSASNIAQTVSDAGVYQKGNIEGAPSDGVYTKFDIDVTIGIGDVPFTPKPADTIQWLGNTYTVLRVQSFNWLQYHSLTARNLILAYQLVQSGTLTRPSNTEQDAAGRQALATYTTVASAIPCRVQPIGGDAGDYLERRGIPQRFVAFLGMQVVPQALDVFTVSGIGYTVLDFKMPERIDELMTLSLELIDTGTSPPPPPPPPVGSPSLNFSEAGNSQYIPVMVM